MFANFSPQDFYMNQYETERGECEWRCGNKPCQSSNQSKVVKYLLSKSLQRGYKEGEWPSKHPYISVALKRKVGSGLPVSQEKAHPIEQTMRQKAARDERAQQLADQGVSKEEIMKIRRSKIVLLILSTKTALRS